MRQVPVNQSHLNSSGHEYLLVGDGRMARHMARYLEFKNIQFATWSRRFAQSQNQKFEEAVAGARTILLLISDDAIEAFAEANELALEGRNVVHFSGALVTARAHAFHPLMTFGHELYDAEFYEQIPFVVDRGGPSFEKIFPGLKNPSFEIDSAQRPLYHALCVMAGNFTTLLWSKAMNDFESRLGLPNQILKAYAFKTIENVMNRGASALTGPLARRDYKTLEKNLAALDGDAYQKIYRAFAELPAPTLKKEN